MVVSPMVSKPTAAGFVGSSWVAERLGVSRKTARKIMEGWPEVQALSGRLRLSVDAAEAMASAWEMRALVSEDE